MYATREIGLKLHEDIGVTNISEDEYIPGIPNVP
jgi:hypothetical protein